MSQRSVEERTAILRAFGRSLRKCRLDRGWTQQELADRSGLSRTFLGSMERGDRGPGFDQLMGVARALAVQPGNPMVTWADVFSGSAQSGAAESTRRPVLAGDAVSDAEIAAADAEWRFIIDAQSPINTREEVARKPNRARRDDQSDIVHAYCAVLWLDCVMKTRAMLEP